MFLTVQFDDFRSDSQFLNLQNRFYKYDVNTDPNTNYFSEVQKEDFTIVYREQISNEDEKYITISFYEDFLYQKIDKLAKDTIDDIKKQLIAEFKYNSSGRREFIKQTLNDFFELEGIIEKIPFLRFKIMLSLLSQCRIVIEYLSSNRDDFDFSEKIQFNINSTDVLLLMHLLRKNKIINHPFDSKLGFLLESFFEYRNDETGEYTHFTGAGKSINNIKNGNKSVGTSIERLKEIFNKKDFFEL